MKTKRIEKAPTTSDTLITTPSNSLVPKLNLFMSFVIAFKCNFESASILHKLKNQKLTQHYCKITVSSES